MKHLAATLLLSAALAMPALAQSEQDIGQMRLYIQQLEDRVRQLTGENERLGYELNQMRAQLGLPALQAAPAQTGAVSPLPQGDAVIAGNPDLPAVAPQDPGALSVSPDDPLIAPDGVEDGAPVDLSALAGGVAGELLGADVPPGPAPAQPGLPDSTQMAGLPGTPPPTAALSGSARDEYDLAYGYVLTGDYDLAEESFRNWLAVFPGDPQAADAQFWLGESHLQQGEYREAANTFLAVYKQAPASAKAADSLLRLGMSLSALGEQNAACATFGEVGRKYPQASEALMSRVRDEEARAGC